VNLGGSSPIAGLLVKTGYHGNRWYHISFDFQSERMRCLSLSECSKSVVDEQLILGRFIEQLILGRLIKQISLFIQKNQIKYQKRRN
jgi:hypothetical protein